MHLVVLDAPLPFSTHPQCNVAFAVVMSAKQRSLRTWGRHMSSLGTKWIQAVATQPEKHGKSSFSELAQSEQGSRSSNLMWTSHREMSSCALPHNDAREERKIDFEDTLKCEMKSAEDMDSGLAKEIHSSEIGGSAFGANSRSMKGFIESPSKAVGVKRLGAVLDNDVVEDSTSKLKAEFEAARLCFENVPSALREMPRMNPNGVYANHNLRLDQILVYGFDYDYTLAHYTTDLQTLIYDLAKEHLVKEHRYPESCLKFKYDKGFPIRGLYYDKKKGNLLKLDFFHSVEPEGCFFGRQRLSKAEIEAAYGGRHISVEHMPNLVALMDLFCLSEVCLISDVIQHFVDQKVEFDSSYVYEDVKRSIDFVHKSGLLHKKILEEPAKYLLKSDGVVQLLRTLKERGKRLFLLTNSPFPFVNGGMRYMFQEDGAGGDSWRELFDVVIALADKPNFYTSERPFRYYNSQRDILAFSTVEEFHKHSVYYHGCLKNFIEITKWKGPEVLYFGDHLYSDLRGPAKAGWRTAAIIRELEREIQNQNEDKYRFQQAKYHIMQELLGKFHGLPMTDPRGDDEKALLLSIREERQKARSAMKAMFNPYFGSTFLTDTGKESAFAYNVQRYADVYTSKLENFLHQSIEAWLCTPFDVKILPHHIKVNPSLLK